MLRKLFYIYAASTILVLASTALFAVSANPVSAQETFAPLITDNCVGFVHVDLRNFDLDRTKSVIAQNFENHLKSLNFSEKSLNATMNEFKKESKKIDELIRPHAELITKNLGITELAIIVDPSLTGELGDPPIVAVSWKNKTNADLEKITSLIEKIATETAIQTFIARDFLFIYNSDIMPENQIKQIITQINKSTPSKNAKIYNALKDANNAEFKIAFLITEKIRKEFIKISDNNPDLNEQVKNLILFSMNKIEWITASASLGQFISPDSKKESYKIIIKTPKENDATFLQKLLEGSIDNGVFIAKIFAESQPDKFKIPPLAIEYLAGLLRQFLPEVKNDRLVFLLEDDPKNQATIKPVAILGFAGGLIIPAIQSIQPPRISDRKLQCSANMKQIVIAFHHYHVSHKEFPPLYTVDKNGNPLHSWRVLILPYIEQNALFESIRLDEPWDSEYNKQFHNLKIPIYSCPGPKADPNKRCNYVVIEGQPLTPNEKTDFSNITDGMSNTISIIEVKEPFCWMDPKANITLKDLEKGINQKDSVIGEPKGKGINIGLWDGSAKQLPNDTPIKVLKALATANGKDQDDLSNLRYGK
jgi:hypothetical protein